VNCRKASKKCSDTRPCERCTAKGIPCYDVDRKGRLYIEPTLSPVHSTVEIEYSHSWRSDTSLDQHMNLLGLHAPQIDTNELYRVDHSSFLDIHDAYSLEQPFEYYSDSNPSSFIYLTHQSPPVDPEVAYREEEMISSMFHYSDDDFPQTQDSFQSSV
jgi:hypothetical protein